jgi:spore germination protein
MFALLLHLSLLKSYGHPYLLPFIAVRGDKQQRQRDTLLRFPLQSLWLRSLHAREEEKRKFREEKAGEPKQVKYGKGERNSNG